MTSGSAHRRKTAREAALARAIEDGLLGPGAPLVGLLDVDGVLAAVDALNEAFEGPATVQHTFAVKACGLVPVLRLLADAGMGCEVASPGELEQALAALPPPTGWSSTAPRRRSRSWSSRWSTASLSTWTTSRSWSASTGCWPAASPPDPSDCG